MTSWWWVALIAVVAVAFVASVVDGRVRAAESRRQRRERMRSRPPGRSEVRRAGRPRPGEIWWADVPYEDGPGSKDRPCLVLAVRGSSVKVAKITTKHHAERPGVIPLPAGTVGDSRGRPSFLETDEVREVRASAFRRRAGAADPALWDRVRRLV
ncbi:type II toxin-antitoxin system PemK/MazF family toxin [Streptomyces sp. NRRL F-5126]|uniref:type II toxin-antitoxin system PemK/MazF family toxin n=1 Tax=Streptomyces sp. NRRL F-5126 TaxID=1463857 RepID=UPI0004C5A8BD|nr:type II toxin-antitoxin system PemK/MazF family toxin [Streptomyces sp. NRRL F-5126]